jgi:hypothetical protein
MSKHGQTVLTILMIGIVISTSTLLISLWLLPPQERTAILSIFDENQQTNYPTNITQNSNITLYVEVENQMNVVQYFYVYVKLASPTTMADEINPSPASPIQEYERILLHGDRWLFSTQLNMTTLGINLRLTFELWRYDLTTDRIDYTGIWVHLPLNVTAS